MDTSLRVVNTIPLTSIWLESELIDVKRGKYLGENDISELLKEGPIQFIIANVGDKLIWEPIENCYKIYKTNIKDHIISEVDNIDLSIFKDNFGYLASLWAGKSNTQIVLLEKIH